ncbi:MAG: YdbH domain-containing protein [Candidatus Omnitrophota bacterium]
MIFRRDIALRTAESRLEKTFIDSTVSIQRCGRFSTRSLELSTIEISRKGYYDLLIEDVRIEYSLLALFTGRIKKVSVEKILLAIDNDDEDPKNVIGWLDISDGGLFRLDEAVVSDALFFIVMKGFACEGRASFAFSPEKKEMKEIDIAIPILKSYGVSLKDLNMKGSSAGGAKVTIGEIAYKDFLITNASGAAKIVDSFLVVSPFAAQIFDGVVRGVITLAFDHGGGFSIDINSEALNMANLVEDLKLAEKVQLTGKLSGNISLSGMAFRVTEMSGEFSTKDPGGVLIIKDTRFLENMAMRSDQALDLLMETFNNYQYTIGTMSVALDERDLRFEIELNGDAGKRAFDIVIHDFIKE